jgi:hypothetical protein
MRLHTDIHAVAQELGICGFMEWLHACADIIQTQQNDPAECDFLQWSTVWLPRDADHAVRHQQQFVWH